MYSSSVPSRQGQAEAAEIAWLAVAALLEL
jgi:hypothetical protein